jgi:predicted ATPase
MLKRLYVDNYRSLVNFEFKPGAINLLLGENGSGKSAVFGVLWGLQNVVVNNGLVEEYFGRDTVTRWETRPIQTFELDFTTMDGHYRYQLQIERTDDKASHIKQEKLIFDNQLLLDFDGTTVHFFPDNNGDMLTYPLSPARSPLALLPQRDNNTKHIRFKNLLAGFIIVQPIPTNMVTRKVSQKEIQHPQAQLDDFVDWYRYLIQDTGFSVKLNQDLAEILPEFDALILENVGRSEKLLRVRFSENSNQRILYDFDELSDGQRMLIILYTLLHLPERDGMDNLILCIDEPDNFVALREIQPWLRTLYDCCHEGRLQALLISHHPETINYLLMPSNEQIGYWFERGNLQPTRVKPIATQPEQPGIAVSEQMALGWFSHE